MSRNKSATYETTMMVSSTKKSMTRSLRATSRVRDGQVDVASKRLLIISGHCFYTRRTRQYACRRRSMVAAQRIEKRRRQVAMRPNGKPEESVNSRRRTTTDRIPRRRRRGRACARSVAVITPVSRPVGRPGPGRRRIVISDGDHFHDGGRVRFVFSVIINLSSSHLVEELAYDDVCRRGIVISR